jgi:hypothetical protein
MAGSGHEFSRQGRFAWAFIGIFFASGFALALALLIPSLGTCQQCGASFSGTICYGSNLGGCGTVLAGAASWVVGLTGCCVVTAVNASAAYRAKRGAPVASLLARAGRSRGVMFQVASITLICEGAQLLNAGLLVPILQVCREGCPVPYAIVGLSWLFVDVGVFLLVVGVFGFVVGRNRALARLTTSDAGSTI